MATKTNSSNTLLIALVLLITFPFWFMIGGVLIGVIGGIFGAIIGVMGAMFGVLIGLIALPFKMLFGWGHHDWSFHSWPHCHSSWFTTLAVFILIGLVLSRRKK